MGVMESNAYVQIMLIQNESSERVKVHLDTTCALLLRRRYGSSSLSSMMVSDENLTCVFLYAGWGLGRGMMGLS
jgi:hypothetical protein